MSSFDTLKYSQNLQKGGFTQAQAESMSQSLNSALDEQVATRRDIKELELKIEQTHMAIEQVRADLKLDIAKSQTTAIRWQIGIGFAIMAMLMKLLSQ